MEINKEMTLAEIVKADYHTAGLLESLNLDYCCRGKRTLKEACNEAGLKVDDVIEKLENSPNQQDTTYKYDEWELDFLVDYIVNIHHSYVKKYMPLIAAHSEKVMNAHSENHPEVKEITELFATVKNELESHMMKEERMLFPYMKKLAEAKRGVSEFELAPFGTIQNPIKVMEMEHEGAGNLFYRIRELSNNYSVPADGCITFKTLYDELKEFENDLHIHIHLENNILHPKAIELEKNLSKNIFHN